MVVWNKQLGAARFGNFRLKMETKCDPLTILFDVIVLVKNSTLQIPCQFTFVDFICSPL